MRPRRENDIEAELRIRAVVQTTAFLTLPVEVFDLAATLRAEQRLKTPDALHLACAIHHGCDEFWTRDARILACNAPIHRRTWGQPLTSGRVNEMKKQPARPAPSTSMPLSSPPSGAPHPLDTLWATIETRATSTRDVSYTRQLLDSGPRKIQRKVIEEAFEVCTALDDHPHQPEKLAAEAADLVFHLFVLFKASGVSPSAIYDELDRRRAQSGLDEKASRKATKPTATTPAATKPAPSVKRVPKKSSTQNKKATK